ncbi:MAG: hypothetical protein OEW08_05395 [Gammaproteobacteria bacterium]|nr:hypothetical protein [Gammaproteobacteria bacterium]
MEKKQRVLIIDADHSLGAALSKELTEAGHSVTTHARNAEPGIDISGTDISSELSKWDAAYGPFERIVFGLQDGAEVAETPEDISRIQHELSRTLGEIKAGVQILSRREDGQVWVLLQEDSMQYYLPVAAQPMRSRALVGAIKSLAKEVFCFGVKLNALHVQPLAEQLDAALWKDARAHLKAFAIKFKPQKSIDVAKFLRALIELKGIPLAGMVLPVGIGYPENNV